MKSIRVLVFLLCFLLLAGCVDQWVPYGEIDFAALEVDENNEDYQCILNAEIFAYGRYGYSGGTPQELYALKHLMQEKNALDYLYMLETKATNAGKLYALCGLYFKDPGNYDTLIETYKDNEERVEHWVGCSFGNPEIRSFIVRKYEEYPTVELNGVNDTIDQWHKRNPGHDTYAVDFRGGGIPSMALDTADDERQ